MSQTHAVEQFEDELLLGCWELVQAFEVFLQPEGGPALAGMAAV